MMNVRFPSGFSVQYNTATKISYQADCLAWELKDKDGYWVASISTASGALIESTPACRAYDAMKRPATPDDLRTYDRTALKRLKAALQEYNAVTGEWAR